MRSFKSGVIVCFLSMAVAASVRSAIDNPEPPKPPLGLPEVFWPEDNPYSPEKVDLGRLLYFDKRLSSDHTVSCASCHSPAHAYGDAAPVSTGIKGQKGGRSAPTVINRAYSTSQFWDGRAASLEDQAKGPIANPIEMTASNAPSCPATLRSTSTRPATRAR
jgi:cytochrome c peroxidase